MMFLLCLSLLLATATCAWGDAQGSSRAVAIGITPPLNASAPILEAFVSYSIEFAFFPDFAGLSILLLRT